MTEQIPDASQQAHARFAELKAQFENDAAAQPAPEPSRVNSDLLAEADRMQAQRGSDGRRLYEHDQNHREKTEALRRQAFAGGSPAPAAKPATPPLIPDNRDDRGRFGTFAQDPVPPGVDKKVFEVQRAKLEELGSKIDPTTGRKFSDVPEFRDGLHKAREALFNGDVYVGEFLKQFDQELSAAEWGSSLDVPGFGRVAVEGVELHGPTINKFAEIAKQQGVTPQQFQALLNEYAAGVE